MILYDRRRDHDIQSVYGGGETILVTGASSGIGRRLRSGFKWERGLSSSDEMRASGETFDWAGPAAQTWFAI